MELERFDIFDEIQPINEEVFVDTKKKLRDAVHDIVSELDSKEEIDYEEICNKLKEKYNINIGVEIFAKIISDWWTKRNYEIFKEKDRKWLDPWVYRNTIEKKTKTTAVLGKSRRKIEREEREKKWQTNRSGWHHRGNSLHNKQHQNPQHNQGGYGYYNNPEYLD